MGYRPRGRSPPSTSSRRRYQPDPTKEQMELNEEAARSTTWPRIAAAKFKVAVPQGPHSFGAVFEGMRIFRWSNTFLNRVFTR